MIGIVISTFNKPVTKGLLDGCLKALSEKGIEKKEIQIYRVPGAFEIPALVNILAKKNSLDAIISLGCVIKGETDHYNFICEAVSKGMMDVTIMNTLPILFGVLTCQNKELALSRSLDNRGNKGYEVGLAAIEQIENFNSL
ncbi:6,7-dimethyl-8-ribityllumazine synthase [Candidatus Marinimicrobia bacterium]|jgi:6,7-dimethyl-8-ribityllumazine synthase|nr:6,7-dimethyl-8-ribityllumazine synthase [Candidatus Neomarinimicrobiota bacterium]MDA8753007.1 6,7-dimethyl-8-ribityllumazine synthase [Candidatus Neomarinimicrobiota bacterium]MDC0630559.1 6,7-dimethyl-8-ribityllumazine synthase [Candidatus Neomarinimicrobiota bacterium]